MKQRGEETTFDFRALLEKQNRTRLAVVLGGAAMLLLLLILLIRRSQKKKTGNVAGSERK